MLNQVDVLDLQRTAGNRAVMAALAGAGTMATGGGRSGRTHFGASVQRVWSGGQVGGKTTLRKDPDGKQRGGPVRPGAPIVVDPQQDNGRGFVPAVIMSPTNFDTGAAEPPSGYIRATKAPTQKDVGEYLKDRVGQLLKRAEARHPQLLTGHLNKPEHIYDPVDFALLKPFRYRSIKPGLPEAMNAPLSDFREWMVWKNRVSDKLEEGANHAADQLAHWRENLFPFDPSVGFKNVKLTASDLHDEGLGAMLVEFDKPAKNGKQKFAIKPEDRGVEAAMFGSQPTSMASRLNEIADLGSDRAITTFLFETHKKYGTLIEFCKGKQAKDLSGNEKKSPAFWEALSLTMIAGLSDAHRENVMWMNERPYFIDADNALNWHRMNLASPAGHEKQTGFTLYSGADSTAGYAHLAEVFKDPTKADPSKSKLLAALARDAKPVVDEVEKAFTGKRGRAVPLVTNAWGTALQSSGLMKPGTPDDKSVPPKTRWGLANERADWVGFGSTQPYVNPGLVAETGIGPDGDQFARGVEAQETYADLNTGKIPFYHYEFDTGFVIHNGQVIWHGKPLREVLRAMLARFPKQG